MWWEIVNVLFLLLAGSVGEHCDANNQKCDPNDVVDCSRTIRLIDIEDDWTEREKVFFVESSGRPYLHARQLCSVESAVRNAGGRIAAVVAMTSDTLDLSESNATCRIYNEYGETSVFFRHVNMDKVFGGTALHKVWKSGVLDRSRTPVVNYSDAIRLALLYKYGGFYSDLDVVVLKGISHLENVFASDQVLRDAYENDPSNYGNAVSNAIFHVERGHWLAERAVEGFAEAFRGNVWASGGPTLLTSILMEECRGSPKRQTMRPDAFNRERCGGVEVLPPSSFYPVGWFEAQILYSHRTDEFWDDFFMGSYAAHFYNSSRGDSNVKIMKPRYYGRERPALLYLALRHCPISFDSVRLF